jgi:hypothetical protein
MATPIVTKNLRINQESGLEEVLKVWAVNINAETEMIDVMYKIYEILPSGLERLSSGEKHYYRYNHPNNMSFNTWRNSSLGQGITQAIFLTLENYPILEQNIEPPVEG